MKIGRSTASLPHFGLAAARGRFAVMAFAAGVLCAAAPFAYAADPAPAPAPAPAPMSYTSKVATGVGQCSTQLNNCMALCPPTDPKCVAACDTAHASCTEPAPNAGKK